MFVVKPPAFIHSGNKYWVPTMHQVLMGTVLDLGALTFAPLSFPVLIRCSPEEGIIHLLGMLHGRARLWRSHPAFRLSMGPLLGIL